MFSYRWVSRERACADLVAFLSNDPPRSRRRRDVFTAAQLLRNLAVPEVAPALRKIALDSSHDDWVRWCCVVALARSGATFSKSEIENVLALEPLRSPDLGELLEVVVRDDESLDVAREVVARSSPEKRAQLFCHGGTHGLESTAAFRALREEVYARWLEHDRHVLGVGHNGRVAVGTLERPSSRRILEELLRTASGEDRGRLLERVPDEEVVAFVRGDPDLLRKAVDLLVLPVAELVTFLGEEALLQGLERRIRELSALFSTNASGYVTHGEAHRTVNVFVDWARFAGARACDRIEALLETDLDRLFVPKLERALFSVDRARAARWFLEHFPRGETILRCIALDPLDEDRALLERALDASALRYVAIDGLEALGGMDRALLEKIARDDFDEVVRLRARGALALRGDEESERLLASRANASRGIEARAEAVRWLSELDPVKHFDVLENALLAGLDFVDDYFQPVAEAAAYGVARRGGVEAMSALFVAAFLVGNSASSVVEDALHDLIEGRAPRRQTRWRAARLRRAM